MKTILCYGDSNTYGVNPYDGTRYPKNKRWTGILQDELGEEYDVIEEGLGGRTTVWDDPIEEYKNGKTYLYPCLASHKPLNYVILMLGTNDLKQRFSLSPQDIGFGLNKLINIIEQADCGANKSKPKIIVVSPPPIGKLNQVFSDMYEGAVEKAKKLSGFYLNLAVEKRLLYLDSYKILKIEDGDGLHLSEWNHKILAHSLTNMIKQEEKSDHGLL